MYTPVQVAAIAKISEYLWNGSIPKTSVFFNGVIDPRKAQQIYMERLALEYGIAQGLSGIQGVSSYVYALCGGNVLLATQIFFNGVPGGGIVPGGGGSTDRSYSAYGSPGQITITFTDAIGTELLTATRGGIEVGVFSSNPVPTGNDVFWNPATGTLRVAADVPFVEDELIRILVK